MSSKGKVIGSELGVSSSMAAVSAVAGEALMMDGDGVAGVRRVGGEERFFDALVAGRRGHECES